MTGGKRIQTHQNLSHMVLAVEGEEMLHEERSAQPTLLGFFHSPEEVLQDL